MVNTAEKLHLLLQKRHLTMVAIEKENSGRIFRILFLFFACFSDMQYNVGKKDETEHRRTQPRRKEN